jgi:cellulose 1,4-beta-cellobiosidase
MKAKYTKIAQIPTFVWLDTLAKVPTLATHLTNANIKNQVLQIVVYDLPDRDCGGQGPKGEFSVADGGEAKYKAYIDQIVSEVKSTRMLRRNSRSKLI